MNVLGKVLVAALVVAGIVALGTVVAKRSAAVRGRVDRAIEQLTTAPDTPAGPALYGRHRAQREAAFAMQAYLRRLVALDSTASDSMYPLRFQQRAEQLRADPGIMGPYIRLTPNGWWATIQSMYSTIMCSVAVGPDTTIRGAPSGTPVCYTPGVEPDTAGDSTEARFTAGHIEVSARDLAQPHPATDR